MSDDGKKKFLVLFETEGERFTQARTVLAKDPDEAKQIVIHEEDVKSILRVMRMQHPITFNLQS